MKEDSKIIKRAEAELGKQYERHVFALISLKCLLDPNIEDFWIASNLASINKFDDVIIHVTYKDKARKKELFLIQVKSKKNCNKPIVASMFYTSNKDFCLTTYKEAYKTIVTNENTLKLLEYDKKTRIFFVIFNNCKISVHESKENIGFEKSDADFRRFITSKKNEELKCFKIRNEDDSDQEFLDQFYFYPEQLELHEIKEQIQNILSDNGQHTIAEEYLQYFYNYPDPKHSNMKLTKLQFKFKILSSSSICRKFTPPEVTPKNFNIVNTFKKFNVTVISDDGSERIIWSEILYLMQMFFEEKLNFSTWDAPYTEDEENIRNKLLFFDNEKLSIKKMYLFMVATSKVPFYERTEHRSADINVYKLLTNLQIYSVIYNTEKKYPIAFPNSLRVFKNMKDMDEVTFEERIRRIFVSFRNKRKIPMGSLFADNEFGKYISSDQYIQLYNKILSIGSNVGTKNEMYINRTLERSFVSADVLLNSDDILYIICNFPLKIMDEERFVQLRVRDGFTMYSTKLNTDEFDSVDESSNFHLMTTAIPYSTDILQRIISMSDNNLFFVFQYESDYDGNLSLVHTNTNVDNLREFVKKGQVPDHKLVDILRASNINIVCNNAGMGKSMLLHYLLRSFPEKEWVVYLELSKYPAINKVKNFEDLIDFIYNNGLAGCVDPNFTNICKYLFDWYAKNAKLVLLIDDFEEIHEKALLQVFKRAASRGFRLWIVARPHQQRHYENLFGVFSLELTQFTKEDQTKFFKKFFRKNKYKNHNGNKQKLATIRRITDTLETSFIGICQQTMMLAEILNVAPKSQLDSTLGLYGTYLNIVIKKYYPEKFELVLKTLSQVSLTNVFKESTLKKVFDLKEFDSDNKVFKNFKEEMSKNSLVTFRKDGIPVFSHKTYAEFLAARWLSIMVKRQIAGETPLDLKELIKCLYSRELTNVRWFFDQMLAMGQKHIRINNLSPIAAPYVADLLGRNIFHYTMTYGDRFNLHISEYNEESLNNSEEYVKLIRTHDQIILKVPESVNEEQHFDLDQMFNCSKAFFLSSEK